VWAGGLGWLIFGHLPDSWGLTGMVLVCASGMLVAIWNSAANSKQ
jgi:drug/metabolite transporter (DMT)-like permease